MSVELRSEAESVVVKVPNDKQFNVVFDGRQIKFLLSLIKANHFPGDKVFLVSETIHALQKPLLDDAHGSAEHPPPASE